MPFETGLLNQVPLVSVITSFLEVRSCCILGIYTSQNTTFKSSILYLRTIYQIIKVLEVS